MFVSVGTAPQARRASQLVILALVGCVILSSGCGNSTPKAPLSTVPTAAPPAQPSYPSTPPVPITWSPQSSLLPAPPAQVPPPAGSNDFPLTISNPIEGETVTSPINVVANANPENPIFFMRVYVDHLAVYYTFANSGAD